MYDIYHLDHEVPDIPVESSQALDSLEPYAGLFEWYGDPLGLAFWSPPRPATPPALENVATDQNDSSSHPDGQLLPPPTTPDVPNPDQSAPTTEPIPSSSSHTSSFHANHSSTGFSIRLLKPEPIQRIVNISRIENNVYLAIDLPSQSPWNAIQVPSTKSVITDDSPSIGENVKPLLLVVIVRGATRKQQFDSICDRCEKRVGQRMGSPSLIDFHSRSNIIRPKGETVHVHFTFCCYSQHHQDQYVLEVILKDASNPSDPIVVAKEELPCSFQVGPLKRPRKTNIAGKNKARRRAEPGATPSAQLEMGPHPEGIERQTRQEQMAGEISDRDHARCIGRGQSYGTPITLENPPPFALVCSSFESPNVSTNTEKIQTRAIMAEREVQITALEMKVRGLRASFEAESQEKFAALQPFMEQLNSRLSAIQKQLADHLDALKASFTAQVADIEAQIDILKQDKTYATSFVAPIRRLPVGILAEVFSLSILSRAQSPLQLMLVCRNWHFVILEMLRRWPAIRLATSTDQPSNAGFIVEQTKAIPLDVDINACTGGLQVVDGGEVMRSASFEMVAKEVKRWRTLAITSLPHKTKTDIDACLSRAKPAFTFNGPMDGLQSFKIKSTCENSALLDQLLGVVSRSPHDELTDMELSSPNAIHYLARSEFATIFRRLVTFKVDVSEMRTEVDILASFERLETLEAHHLRLPSYPIKTDLPLVRTLRRMKIKLVSVQWMVGRTFPNMEECTLIRPCSPETLAPGGGVDLPTCTQFTYDSHTIDVLPNFRIPKLDTLTVRNDVWNKVRGSSQLAAVWSGVDSQVTPLKPRVLHLDTQCNDQHLINALEMLPELEELYLGVVRPDGFGKVFFGALCSLGAKKGRRSHSPSSPGTLKLCPNLRTFGIRYSHWIRDGQHDEITPLLYEIIKSRQEAGSPLQSVKFWATKDITDDRAVEFCRPAKDVGGDN